MSRGVAGFALAAALAAALAGCVGGSGRDAPRSARGAPAGPVYVVRAGDTLSAIAQRFGVQMSALARANGIDPPYLIRIGQQLTVPAGARAPVQTVSRPVVQPLPQRTPAPSYLPPTGLPPSAAAQPGQRIAGAPRLAWPADGPVVENFGAGLDTRGIAISAHEGAAVRAAAAGTVIFAGSEPQKYGQLVLVDHGGGWVTAYGYLSRLTVSTGESVRAGSRVGFVGSTGVAKTPRLHFELRRDNTPVDPLPQLPPRF